MSIDEHHAELVDLVRWIDTHAAGVEVPADERSMLALGCFDVAIEHQAAIAMLCGASLHGAAFALLRVLAESLVRGLWLLHCASEPDLARFKRGKLGRTFDQLIAEFEATIQTPNGVLSGFKASAWTALNGFTHTGYHQVCRRHAPGRVEGTYSEEEVAKAMRVAGALGLIAAGQVIAMSGQNDRLPLFVDRITVYAKNAA